MELPMLKEKEKPLNKGLRMLLIIIPMELGGGGTFKVGKEEFPKRIHSHFYIHRRRRNYRK
jgi:hypothetical protein